jgi:hypothetical protein
MFSWKRLERNSVGINGREAIQQQIGRQGQQTAMDEDDLLSSRHGHRPVGEFVLEPSPQKRRIGISVDPSLPYDVR